MAMTMHLDIVSAEKSLYSGLAEMLTVNGELGEMGVAPGHAPLLTSLKPGAIKVIQQGGTEDFFYVSGGLLEIQSGTVTVLANTAMNADDVDEAAALAARERAEKIMKDQQSEISYSKAAAELAEAVAQLKALNMVRKKLGK